jgi:hypothetical protein
LVITESSSEQRQRMEKEGSSIKSLLSFYNPSYAPDDPSMNVSGKYLSVVVGGSGTGGLGGTLGSTQCANGILLEREQRAGKLLSGKRI